MSSISSEPDCPAVGARPLHRSVLRRLCVVAVAAAGLLTLGGPAAVGAGPGVDLTGTWECCATGGAASSQLVFTSGTGSLAGKAELPDGTVFASISGSVAGNQVRLVETYNSYSSGYVGTLVGTVSADGASMSGTWTSNQNQSGTWTATRGKKASLGVDWTMPQRLTDVRAETWREGCTGSARSPTSTRPAGR